MQLNKEQRQPKQLLNLMKHVCYSTSCLEIKDHSQWLKGINSCQHRIRLLLHINRLTAIEEALQMLMLLQCNSKTMNTLPVASNTAIKQKPSRTTKKMNSGTKHRKVLLKVKVVTELLTIIENLASLSFLF